MRFYGVLKVGVHSVSSLKKKPAKYGLKVFAQCDARLYYTSNLEVYVGTQPQDSPFEFSNAAVDVKRMIEPISGSNRNVTTDNWFTTLQLSKKLLNEHRLTHLRTIKEKSLTFHLFFLSKGKTGTSLPVHLALEKIVLWSLTYQKTKQKRFGDFVNA